jgi:hypothetical protein
VPEHTALGFVVFWIMTNIVKAAVWHVIKLLFQLLKASCIEWDEEMIVNGM